MKRFVFAAGSLAVVLASVGLYVSGAGVALHSNPEIAIELKKKGLRMVTGRVYNAMPSRHRSSDSSDDDIFNAIKRLPKRYREANAYFVGYGSVLPIMTDEVYDDNSNVLDLLNQGIVSAPELGDLDQEGLHVLYGHSTSVTKSPFSAAMLPTILFGEEGTSFSLYVRQDDESYLHKSYRMQYHVLDVDPNDVSLLEEYAYKDGDHVIIVVCRDGNVIGSLKKRMLMVAVMDYEKEVQFTEERPLPMGSFTTEEKKQKDQENKEYHAAPDHVFMIDDKTKHTIRQFVKKMNTNRGNAFLLMLGKIAKLLQDDQGMSESKREILRYMLHIGEMQGFSTNEK